MPPRDGSARPVAPGRLKSFEDVELPDMQPAPLSLPPRAPAGPAEMLRAVPEPALPSASEADPTVGPSQPAPPSVQGGGGKPRSRASNMLLPAQLHARVTAYAQATARSHGDVIMDAIEANIDELRPLFAPAPQASSGSIFGARPVRAPRPPEGPKVQLNYRLRSDYFAALEDLVVQLRAGTRTHLILTALQMYFEKIDQEG